MTMEDFAKIVKQANILSNAKPDIIFRLLQALGAKDAISESGKRKKIEHQTVHPLNRL